MFGKYSKEEAIKLPTFSKYLQENAGTKKLSQSFTIEVIWLPGKYPNFTLQTHAFRLSVSNKHPLYKGIEDYVAWIPKDEAIFVPKIKITNAETGEYEVIQCTKIKGVWQRIGSVGFRLEQ